MKKGNGNNRRDYLLNLAIAFCSLFAIIMIVFVFLSWAMFSNSNFYYLLAIGYVTFLLLGTSIIYFVNKKRHKIPLATILQKETEPVEEKAAIIIAEDIASEEIGDPKETPFLPKELQSQAPGNKSKRYTHRNYPHFITVPETPNVNKNRSKIGSSDLISKKGARIPGQFSVNSNKLSGKKRSQVIESKPTVIDAGKFKKGKKKSKRER